MSIPRSSAKALSGRSLMYDSISARCAAVSCRYPQHATISTDRVIVDSLKCIVMNQIYSFHLKITNVQIEYELY